MALQTKVKSLFIGGAGILMPQAAGVSAQDTVEYQFQDKYRIIGAEIIIAMDVNSALAVDAGDAFALGSISMSGVNPGDGGQYKDGNIISRRVKWRYAEEAGGCSFVGEEVDEAEIFFPEGHGIDVEEWQKIYIHVSGINRQGATGGDMACSVWAHLFVVER